MKSIMKIGIGIITFFIMICLFIPTNVVAEGYVTIQSQSISPDNPRQNKKIDLVELTIKNAGEDQIRITSIYVHFDWMDSDKGYKKDYSGDYIYLATGQTLSDYWYSISVDESVEVGSHQYQFWVYFEEDDGWLGWSSESYKSYLYDMALTLNSN